jgi:hypothetical protein
MPRSALDEQVVRHRQATHQDGGVGALLDG